MSDIPAARKVILKIADELAKSGEDMIVMATALRQAERLMYKDFNRTPASGVDQATEQRIRVLREAFPEMANSRIAELCGVPETAVDTVVGGPLL